MKAIVVGAGLAGLSAAYRLQTLGWQVTVLEADAAPGGRTTSFRKGPYLLEKGATQAATGYKRYLELARELGLGDEIEPSSNTILLLREGRMYPIDGTRPLSALFTGALGWRSKLKMLRAIRDHRRIDPPVDVLDVSASWAVDTESAKDYCKRRLNREIYDVLVDPIVRTYVINGGDKTSVLEWHSSLANLAGQRLLALKGGIGRLAATLAAKLDVRTHAPVAEVRTVPGGIAVTLQSGEVLGADACVVATKLFQARDAVPELRDRTGPMAEAMPYNRTVVVALGYDRRPDAEAMGVLVSTVEHPQISLLWMEHNKLQDAAPPGHALINCYFDESGLDGIAPNDDARFVEIAEAFVTKLFPELKGHRDMDSVVRWDAAIPHPAPGTYVALHRFKQSLDPAFPIQLAGDYFTCTGQNSAIHWGQVAATNIDRHIGRRNAPAS